VTRIRARRTAGSTSGHSTEPIFRLVGGPGQSNMKFPAAGRFADDHDVVLVGYRGVDGSSRLDCPEVSSALAHADDFLAAGSRQSYTDAFGACAARLTRDGVDLAGYSLAQRVDDLDAARAALGYSTVDLLSESAGTRTAMIYAWRYPASVHRSVMIGVNPPGHYLWDPTLTDAQLRHYADLCAADATCRARTGDLVASMRGTAAHLPDRWLTLPIAPGDVRLASFFGLFDQTSAAPPTGPMVLDAWLAAAKGDPSGFWAMSLFARVIFPTSFVWGDFASVGMADADAVPGHFANEPAGTVLGDPGSSFFWAGGALTGVWPVAPGDAGYDHVRPSNVDTLLIGGTLDFTTPPQVAAKELLPALPNGHQVVLAELGHAPDFWSYEKPAGTHLIATFLDSATVDDSLYTHNTIDFTPPLTFTALAKLILGVLAGLAGLTVVSLALMALRVRRRGGFGRRSGAVLRSVYPPVLGLGGWCLAVLVVLTALRQVPVNDVILTAVSVALPVGWSVYLAWVQREKSRRTGLAAALAGALVGAWLGYLATSGFTALLTTVVGATVGANALLLALDMLASARTPDAADA
jgi:pimeloyl-ACP methyl ester carboxylesterase